MSDFTAQSNLKAKRQHACCECRGFIRPDDMYQRVAGSWDGRMDSFKTCMPCAEARDWATSQIEWTGGDEHLFYFEMLEQDLHDTAMEIHPGTGRRFKAYRLQVEMKKRRHASQTQRQAA